MRRIIRSVAVLLAVCTCAASAAVTLVENGKPAASIVVSEAAFAAKPYKPVVGMRATTVSAAQKQLLAATELQRYLEKISGARLPIVCETQKVAGAAVLLGTGKTMEALGLRIPAGVTPERREEGYLIHASGKTLVLAGNDEGPYQGTFFAVSEFLNRQGVRWFMPGDFGEYVPHAATLRVDDVEYRDAPDFIVRSWNGHLAPHLLDDDALWRLHNKLTLCFNDILEIPGDGWLQRYMPDKSLVGTHPEYFARRIDGTIDSNMVSLANDEVPRLVAEKVKARIAKERATNPNFNSLGFAPYDGAPMDFTKETMAINQGFADLCGREGVPTELSISEEWFRFINKVAEEVNKEYPGFILTSNGYANRTFPPEGVKVNPHVGVMFAAIWADLLHAYDDPKSWQTVAEGQMLKRWGELCPHVFVYNYNFPLIVHVHTPMPMTRKLARNMPLLKKWGIVGFEDEQTFSWMSHGITTFYLRAKLYWHANDDAQAILRDYFTTWYGPAAHPAQAFWDAIEQTLENTPLLMHEDRVLPWVYTDELIATLEKCEREAEKLAKDEPFQTRVRIDRLILEHLKGYLAMSRAEAVGNYPEAVRQADYMFQQCDGLHAISGYMNMPHAKSGRERLYSGCYYWGLISRKEMYQKCLDVQTGSNGTLIVKAPREVKFALDSADLGRIGRWYDPDVNRSGWRTIDTATPFYLQGDNMLDSRGVPYNGYMWYLFELDVPKAAIGKPVHVFAPTVVAEAWVWANGEYIGHRPYVEPYIRQNQLMDMDITGQVKPGKNTLAVRVSTSLSRVGAAEGLCGPLFLYAPVSTNTVGAM